MANFTPSRRALNRTRAEVPSEQVRASKPGEVGSCRFWRGRTVVTHRDRNGRTLWCRDKTFIGNTLFISWGPDYSRRMREVGGLVSMDGERADAELIGYLDHHIVGTRSRVPDVTVSAVPSSTIKDFRRYAYRRRQKAKSAHSRRVLATGEIPAPASCLVPQPHTGDGMEEGGFEDEAFLDEALPEDMESGQPEQSENSDEISVIETCPPVEPEPCPAWDKVLKSDGVHRALFFHFRKACELLKLYGCHIPMPTPFYPGEKSRAEGAAKRYLLCSEFKAALRPTEPPPLHVECLIKSLLKSQFYCDICLDSDRRVAEWSAGATKEEPEDDDFRREYEHFYRVGRELVMKGWDDSAWENISRKTQNEEEMWRSEENDVEELERSYDQREKEEELHAGTVTRAIADRKSYLRVLKRAVRSGAGTASYTRMERGNKADLLERGVRAQAVVSSGKIRVLTAYGGAYVALKPLHQALYDHLCRRHKWIVRGEVTNFFGGELVKQSIAGFEHVVSIDYRSSTDSIRRAAFTGLRDAVLSRASEDFTGNAYLVDLFTSLLDESLPSGRITLQPMGAYFSFPFLCMYTYSHFNTLFREFRLSNLSTPSDFKFSAPRNREKKTRWLSEFGSDPRRLPHNYVNGDDQLGMSNIAEELQSVLSTPYYKSKVNDEKSSLAKRGGVCDMNSQPFVFPSMKPLLKLNGRILYAKVIDDNWWKALLKFQVNAQDLIIRCCRDVLGKSRIREVAVGGFWGAVRRIDRRYGKELLRRWEEDHDAGRSRMDLNSEELGWLKAQTDYEYQVRLAESRLAVQHVIPSVTLGTGYGIVPLRAEPKDDERLATFAQVKAFDTIAGRRRIGREDVAYASDGLSRFLVGKQECEEVEFDLETDLSNTAMERIEETLPNDPAWWKDHPITRYNYTCPENLDFLPFEDKYLIPDAEDPYTINQCRCAGCLEHKASIESSSEEEEEDEDMSWMV